MNSGAPSKVTIAGFTDSQTYNGILGSAINGTHDINNVSIDSYTITLSGRYSNWNRSNRWQWYYCNSRNKFPSSSTTNWRIGIR